MAFEKTERKHALLSASAAYRWLNCPPSARLSETYPDTPSVYAAEGTDAHALCEHKVKVALGHTSVAPENLRYYTDEMEACATGYAEFIRDEVEAERSLAKNGAKPQVYVERRVDLSAFVPEGFGTCDCVIVTDRSVHVIDYKHGSGVPVSAENNPQLMLYALGALEAYRQGKTPCSVAMTIYQPRKGGGRAVDTCEVSSAAIYIWAARRLRPIAAQAFAGKGELKAGDWCRFCRAKFDCAAFAAAKLDEARRDFAFASGLVD